MFRLEAFHGFQFLCLGGRTIKRIGGLPVDHESQVVDPEQSTGEHGDVLGLISRVSELFRAQMGQNMPRVQ